MINDLIALAEDRTDPRHPDSNKIIAVIAFVLALLTGIAIFWNMAA